MHLLSHSLDQTSTDRSMQIRSSLEQVQEVGTHILILWKNIRQWPSFPKCSSGRLTPINLLSHFQEFGFYNLHLCTLGTTMKTDYGVSGFVGPTLLGQPSRRVWEEEHPTNMGQLGRRVGLAMSGDYSR